jgi:RNA polymerase sigma factor (sigma-70 family)
MKDQPEKTKEDADFCEMLKQVKSRQQSRDALLINPVFKRRVPSICQNFTRNAADADDLTNHVRMTIFERLDLFEPIYEQPYGNFFSWVTRIARNKAIDDYRRKRVSYGDIRPEDLFDVADDKIDIQTQIEKREAVERFWTFVSTLDPVRQAIIRFRLEDYSLRKIQEKLAEQGIDLSHVAIATHARNIIDSFIASENARLAAMIERKSEHQSRDIDKDGPPRS